MEDGTGDCCQEMETCSVPEIFAKRWYFFARSVAMVPEMVQGQ
jgi:hypothetical protein